MNAYNRRQLLMMRDGIVKYPKNNASIHELFLIESCIEGFINVLENVDEEWGNDLDTECCELELIYALMLDRGEEIISEENVQKIAIALENIQGMIDIALGISFKRDDLTHNHLLWVVDWYRKQWDLIGSEHRPSFKMISLETSEWDIEFDTKNTAIQDKNFDTVEYNRSENDWVNCFVLENVFRGYGSQNNLFKILEIFRELAERA